MNSETGKWMILIGAGIMLLGILVYFFHDKLHWIGRLPGDIRIEKEHTKVYIPITTMLLLSTLISLVAWLLKKI